MTATDQSDSFIQVTVREDDERGLPPEFQGDFLDVAESGALHDGLAHSSGPSEPNLPHFHVVSKPLTNNAT